MATTYGDNSQRSTNLARVRDNQRRSRARRKEYLNDLETKYRHCEQVGVEASTAIQEAARRVVEENKRLREVLRRHGISSEEDRNEGAVLDGVLGRRWECGGNGGGGRGGGGGRSASPPTLSPATSTFTDQRSSPRIPNVIAPAVPERLLPQQQGQQQGQSQDPVISSSSTTASTTSSGMHTPSSTEWQRPQSQTITTTATMGDYPRSIIPTSIPPQDPEQNFYNDLLPYYDLQNFNPHQQQQQQLQQQQQQQQQNQQQQQQYDSSSCHDVAGVIRAINPDVVPELESEMGCQDGGDCHVPNVRAFDLLDRFSERLNAL